MCIHPQHVSTTGLEYKIELYIPPLVLADHQCDPRAYTRNNAPDEETVYRMLGIPCHQWGQGLSIIPDPVSGCEPHCTMSTLAQLALVGSRRKCLLGYEFIALLRQHFCYYWSASENWQVRYDHSETDSMGLKKRVQFRLMEALKHYPWFQSLPAPSETKPAEKIWYLDYSAGSPRPKRPGRYVWDSQSDMGEKRRK